MEQDGVDGLTIRTLSAQADVSPTSIYQHIGGKQAVSDALIDAYFTDLREQLIAIDESDPVLRLRRAGMIYREHALDAPRHLRAGLDGTGVGLGPALPGRHHADYSIRPGGGRVPRR